MKRSRDTKRASPNKRVKRQADDTHRIELAEAFADRAATATNDAGFYLSTRDDPATFHAVPTLVSLALAASAIAVRKFLLDATGEIKSNNDAVQSHVNFVKSLTPAFNSRILNALLANSAEPLSTTALSTLFLAPTTASLSIPSHMRLGAQRQLLFNISRCNLRILNLSGQQDLNDNALSPCLAELKQLEEVNLKGCIKVGDACAISLAKAAGENGSLKVLNMNLCAVTVKGLRALLARCKMLQVLKLANVNGLTDTTVPVLMREATEFAKGWRHIPLSNLRSLKLRSTSVGEIALSAIISFTPLLTSIDISYTSVHNLDFLALALTTLSLQKLVISGLTIRQNGLEKFFASLTGEMSGTRTSLRTLKLGNLTSGIGKLTDDALANFGLERFENLERLSVFGNVNLGRTRTKMLDFLGIVGRRCKVLDLSQTQVNSQDFSIAFMKDDDYGFLDPAIEILVLDGTKVDDAAMEGVAQCPNLTELHLDGCRVTRQGLDVVLRNCASLHTLNLNGCRGIPVQYRRDYFRAYAEGDLVDSD